MIFKIISSYLQNEKKKIQFSKTITRAEDVTANSLELTGENCK